MTGEKTRTHSFTEETEYRAGGGAFKDTHVDTGNHYCTFGCGTKIRKEHLGHHTRFVVDQMSRVLCRGVKDHVLHPETGVCISCKTGQDELHPDGCPNNA